jgi:hypothetical protein
MSFDHCRGIANADPGHIRMVARQITTRFSIAPSLRKGELKQIQLPMQLRLALGQILVRNRERIGPPGLDLDVWISTSRTMQMRPFLSCSLTS